MAYKNVRKADIDKDRGFYLSKTDFPERSPEFEAHCLYKADDEAISFGAGSYGGYNKWRDQLAKLADYESAKVCWTNPKSGPFIELIDFSDYDGTIGTAISQKLSKDFSEFQQKANWHEDEYFLTKYNEWREAFEFASENGCVVFG